MQDSPRTTPSVADRKAVRCRSLDFINLLMLLLRLFGNRR